MMAHGAARCGTEKAVMAGEVTGNTAGGSAGQATKRRGFTWQGKRAGCNERGQGEE